MPAIISIAVRILVYGAGIAMIPGLIDTFKMTKEAWSDEEE